MYLFVCDLATFSLELVQELDCPGEGVVLFIEMEASRTEEEGGEDGENKEAYQIHISAEK